MKMPFHWGENGGFARRRERLFRRLKLQRLQSLSSNVSASIISSTFVTISYPNMVFSLSIIAP